MPYTEYQIISEVNIFEFTKKMNNLMKDGWQPSGNVSIMLANLDAHLKVVDKGGDLCIIYAQAIVR